MESALLIGNGLNRCHLDKKLSWEALMREIAGKYSVAFHENNSFPLEFECMANRVCQQDGKALDDVIKGLKGDIAAKINTFSPEPDWIHSQFVNLPVREIMTTNYDYYLEKILSPDFPQKWKGEATQDSYGLRRRYIGENKTVRHIHGDADKSNSICLGYDHYARSIVRMRDYFKKEVDLEDTLAKQPLPQEGQLPKKEKKQHFYGESWMELFFTHDIHIVGLSLDVCEIDLWWMLTYRAKLMAKSPTVRQNIKNKVYFYYTTSTPKPTKCDECLDKPAQRKGTDIVALFERLHVECIGVSRDAGYPDAYTQIAAQIQDTITQRTPI